jgi:hypothetical protein
MREIKFRGKLCHSGIWVYGNNTFESIKNKCWSVFEVLGNIHDNQELLKK